MFFRVDDPMSLDGPTFFRWAYRSAAYSGVLRARAEAEEAARRENGDEGYSSAPQSGVRTVTADSATLQSDPELAGIFEKGGTKE